MKYTRRADNTDASPSLHPLFSPYKNLEKGLVIKIQEAGIWSRLMITGKWNVK